MDYVDEILESVSGGLDADLAEVGLTEVGRTKVLSVLAKRGIGAAPPSPPFARSDRRTMRRSPLGLVEDGTGAAFFSLPAVVGATTTMRGKVSRPYHGDRLLVVPSAPGVVITSIKCGDEEQLAAPNAPVELYSSAALTDRLPDNFSPIASGIDFSVTFLNTTAVAITGTAGLKGAVER